MRSNIFSRRFKKIKANTRRSSSKLNLLNLQNLREIKFFHADFKNDLSKYAQIIKIKSAESA